ncbi:hypothetical protein B0O80DRAFT_489552 [Mortierella sp. GBAus27b]|nr:hypothetical protein B0O80DRAFT_489552 [Mortierella sp. GBAus27b]
MSNSLCEDLKLTTSNRLGGKRLDLQLRSGDCEISNSEFKRCSSTKTKMNHQLRIRKNILNNHAIMLHLRVSSGFSLEQNNLHALDVNGWIATIFTLKRVGDVFYSDLVTDQAVILPFDAPTWRCFLQAGFYMELDAKDG